MSDGAMTGRGGSSSPGATPPAAGSTAPGEPRRVPSEGTLERARRMLLEELQVLERAIKAIDARDPERLREAHRTRLRTTATARHALDIALTSAVAELEHPAGGHRA